MCGRGVCPDCIAEDTAEIFCQGRCDQQGAALAEMSQRHLSEHDPRRMARNGFALGCIMLFAGLSCLAYVSFLGKTDAVGTIAVGAFMTLCGAAYLCYVRSYYLKHCGEAQGKKP